MPNRQSVLGNLITKESNRKQWEDWIEPVLTAHKHLTSTDTTIFLIAPLNSVAKRKVFYGRQNISGGGGGIRRRCPPPSYACGFICASVCAVVFCF